MNGPDTTGVSGRARLGPVLPMGPASGPSRAGTASAGRSASPEVAVNLKKVLVWLAIAFVVFYVIQQPESSAEMVRTAGVALGDAASSIAAFVTNLV